jgi:hypothetical protein
MHNNTVTRRLKAGIVEPEQKSIASQQLAKHTFPQEQMRKSVAGQRFGKHFPLAMNKHRKTDNRGTVGHGDLYSVCRQVIKELVQFILESEPLFGIRHS